MAVINTISRKGKVGIIMLSDGEEYPVLLSVIEEHNLKVGFKIDTVELSHIKAESDLKQADYYLSYILAARSYSIGQVNQKLARKGFNSATRSHIIKSYIEKGYLDDVRFTRNMIESMMSGKPGGRAYLLARLRSKFVPDHIARDVIDEALEKTDELAMALQLLESRRRYLVKFDLETARRKAYNYLSRRSISYDAAKKAFEQFKLKE